VRECYHDSHVHDIVAARLPADEGEENMGLLDEMKEVGDLIKKAGDIDLYRRIVKLEGEVTELTRDKRRGEDRIEELERALKFKNELKFEDPYYWLDGDPAPYCPACWSGKRQATHIVTVREQLKYDKHQCPSCKHIFDDGACSSPVRGRTGHAGI
jgi:hypothetical protein